MNLNLLRNIGIAILVAGISYSVGRYLQPASIQEKEVVKEVVKKDIVTVVKEVTRPDGTKETTTTTEDHSTESTSTKKDTKITQAPVRNQWKVNAMAAYLPEKN